METSKIEKLVLGVEGKSKINNIHAPAGKSTSKAAILGTIGTPLVG